MLRFSTAKPQGRAGGLAGGRIGPPRAAHRDPGLSRAATGLLVYLAAWFLLSFFFPDYIIPSPVAVFAGTESYFRPDFSYHLALTLYRVVAGFVCALAAGSALGIVAFFGRKSEHLSSLMLALEVIPGTILGIVLLLALGLGSAVPIVLAALLTLPAIAINTANALGRKNVDLEQYLLSAGGSRRDLIRYLYLPVLVPTSQSNLSIGFGMAIKLVVLGEFIGSQDGLGYLLNVARIYFNMKEVFFYLTIVVVASAVFQALQGLLFSVSLQKYFYPD